MNRRNYLARPQLRDERPRRPVRSAVLVGTLALGLGVGAACGSDDPTKAAPFDDPNTDRVVYNTFVRSVVKCRAEIEPKAW